MGEGGAERWGVCCVRGMSHCWHGVSVLLGGVSLCVCYACLLACGSCAGGGFLVEL